MQSWRLEVGQRQKHRRLCTGRLRSRLQRCMLKAIVRRRRIKGASGEVVGPHPGLPQGVGTSVLVSNLEPCPTSERNVSRASTTATNFCLKLYRKLEDGPNPGREVAEFLTEQTDLTQVPRALGGCEYRREAR